MSQVSGVPGGWVEAWLSEPRFAVYLREACGSRAQAIDLYEWNASVSAAFQHDLAHLEIALRNAYDRALASGRSTGPHWTQAPGALFPPQWSKARNGARIDVNATAREQIERAVREVGPGAPSGKVIAELLFGFWRYWSTTARHQSLWIPYLHKAFMPGTRRRAVHEPVGRLHVLRNRVAHHETLLRLDLTGRHKDILTVAANISTDVHHYIAATSRVPQLLAGRP